MILETVSNIEIAADGLLMLRLEGGGKPSYQHVHRAAAGVYWDQEAGAFKYSTKSHCNYARWFAHVREVLEDEMNLRLRVGTEITWTNVPEDVQNKIIQSNG